VRFTFEKCFVFELFVNGFEKSVFKIITKRGSILCVIMVCINGFSSKCIICLDFHRNE